MDHRILEILNQPGITIEERRTQLLEFGLSEDIVMQLLPFADDAGDY